MSSLPKSKPFTEEELKDMDPAQPKHDSMKLVGTMTLLTVSPFKLSTAQISTLADFMKEPWPDHGADVEIAVNAGFLEVFPKSMASCDDLLTSATGFMKVMRAYTDAVKSKVLSVLSSDSVDFKKLQWNWEYPSPGPGNELTVEDVEREALHCCEELLDLCMLLSHSSEFPGETLDSQHRENLLAVFLGSAPKREKRPLNWLRSAVRGRGDSSSGTAPSRPTASGCTKLSAKSARTNEASQNSDGGTQAPTNETGPDSTMLSWRSKFRGTSRVKNPRRSVGTLGEFFGKLTGTIGSGVETSVNTSAAMSADKGKQLAQK